MPVTLIVCSAMRTVSDLLITKTEPTEEAALLRKFDIGGPTRAANSEPFTSIVHGKRPQRLSG